MAGDEGKLFRRGTKWLLSWWRQSVHGVAHQCRWKQYNLPWGADRPSLSLFSLPMPPRRRSTLDVCRSHGRCLATFPRSPPRVCSSFSSCPPPPNAVQPQPVAREGGDCRSWAGTWLSPSFWEENCLLFCSQTLASFKNTLGSLNIISPK